MPRLIPRFVLTLALALPGASVIAQPAPFSPAYWQQQRRYTDVDVMAVGNASDRAYVFKPARAAAGLPLVIFNHGWLGMNPKNFGGLIDLMVRRGSVVIYPVYQDGDKTAPQQITRKAADAAARALTVLDAMNPGLIDRNKVLYWGFSMGATISLNLALDPAGYGLPAPAALMLVSPGDAHHVAHGERAASIIGPVESLSSRLPVLMVSGAADTGIGVPTARAIAARLCHVPAEHRNLMLLPSDTDEGRKVMAGHGAPGSPDSRYDFPDSSAAVPAQIAGTEDFEASASLNQLDFHGFWRLSLGLLDHVSTGADVSILFSRTAPENRYLGTWPSGKPFAEARIEDPCRPGSF